MQCFSKSSQSPLLTFLFVSSYFQYQLYILSPSSCKKQEQTVYDRSDKIIMLTSFGFKHRPNASRNAAANYHAKKYVVLSSCIPNTSASGPYIIIFLCIPNPHITDEVNVFPPWYPLPHNDNNWNDPLLRIRSASPTRFINSSVSFCIRNSIL